MRIIVQLIDVSSGTLIWSEQFNRDLDDVFVIQDEITLTLVDKLRLDLLGEDKQKLAKRYTINLDAHNLFLKGQYFWKKRTERAIRKSIEYYKKAIKIDPRFALAYAELARGYGSLAFYGYTSPRKAWPKAKIEAQKALELDETLAEVHTVLSLISLWYDWDWPTFEIHIARAIELNPGYAYAHHINADYLRAMWRFDEALNEMKRALELDPLNPMLHAVMGQILLFSGREEQAIEHFNSTLEMQPNFYMIHWGIGMALHNQGKYEKAIETYQKAIKLSGGSPHVYSTLGAAYAMTGQKKKARKILHELETQSQHKYIPPTSIAYIYARLGEVDRALDLYELACDECDQMLLFHLKMLREAENFRLNPRYIALLNKIEHGASIENPSKKAVN